MSANPQSNANHQVWKPDLDFYQDIQALTFDSDDEIDAAIRLLWTDVLRECPHDLAGGDTVIVPAEAVRYFKNAGLRFTQSDVLSPRDIPEDELNEIRREQGPY